MNRICDSNCTGCATCSNICPNNAITMAYNDLGFLSPVIDNEKCVDCGLCTRRCPANHLVDIHQDTYKSYASYALDNQIVRKSSSGGMFYALSKYIIDELQGVVFGAVFDEEFQTKIVSATKMEDIYRMMGSKYVYSDVGYTYRETKTYLEQGKTVLFTGLPCQISGLLNYLNKTYDNLWTVEILCHGAPSQKLLDKYVGYLSNRYKSNVVNIQQRSEHKKWNPLIQKGILIEFADGKVIKKTEDEDAFMSLFVRELSYNTSCYQCAYANAERRADITLGDYGGLGISIKFDKINQNGISFMRINNQRSHDFVQNLDIFMEERPNEEIGIMNSAIVKPTKMPKARENFLKDYKVLSNKELFEKYFVKDYRYRMRSFIKRMGISIMSPKLVAKILCKKK